MKFCCISLRSVCDTLLNFKLLLYAENVMLHSTLARTRLDASQVRKTLVLDSRFS